MLGLSSSTSIRRMRFPPSPMGKARVNIPAVSVGRAESARRFVELKLIVTAALLKPPYRGLGFVRLKRVSTERRGRRSLQAKRKSPPVGESIALPLEYP